MTIKFYKIKDPYGYMSNFLRARFFLDGKWWMSTEHYYQAMKTEDPVQKELVRNAKSPREARELGQKVDMHPLFDSFKDEVMKKCVLAKFVQHAELREQLLSDGSGKNMLGKVLMEIRTELRNGQ